MSEDEKAAEKAAFEYADAIDKHGLDKVDDGHAQSVKRYMIDSYYAGFYQGRDYAEGKKMPSVNKL